MNEMTVYDQNQDVQVYRDPTAVLADAKRAATALAQVVAGKKKPVIMNGEQYLEFEDWQTVGRFYGVTAKVVSTEFMDLSGVQGFQAKAVAIRADGMEVSAAESMCLNDEPNWKSKPLFQLRSMAQTRACAKALRNVLAWVVVLAGYKPTPAEEIQDMVAKPPLKEPARKAHAEKTSQAELSASCLINDVTHKDGKKKDGTEYRVYAITGEDGTKYATFSETFADLAQWAKENGVPAEITYTVGQYGNKITNLTTGEARIVIDFDPATHSYTIDGQPAPSVTQILDATGFVDKTWFTDYGRERGKLVHRIIHWHITGELDEATIDPALQGYFDAWKRFESVTGFISTSTEKPLGSPLHRFCGTPDHIGMLNGHTAIVDCKTGAIAPWVGIQLAGYEILRNEGLRDGGMLRCKRFALALKEDGKYSVKEFTNRQDRGIFLAALACWNWQHNNGRR